jgi:hypothetical protein
LVTFACSVLATESSPKLFKIQDDISVFFHFFTSCLNLLVIIFVFCPYKQNRLYRKRIIMVIKYVCKPDSA